MGQCRVVRPIPAAVERCVKIPPNKSLHPTAITHKQVVSVRWRRVNPVRSAADMKRLKLQHGYHDALIRAVRYHNDDVVLDVDLCGSGSQSPGPATLHLFGLRNFSEVHTALEMARQKNLEHNYVDEIIGIARHSQRGVLLDLATAGALHFDGRGIHET